MIELNRNKIILGDCIEKLKEVDDEIVDLVIADPPYWKVIEEKWDNEWRTKIDYLEWTYKWIDQISRVLRLGGTFYLFGYFRTLALIVPDLEKFGFELRQQILVDKGMRAVHTCSRTCCIL